jgi:hydrogenase nickel incorporation protein HypA/HybF
MHEYSLAQSLLSQALDSMQGHGASAIASLSLTVGEFSGVDSELLREAFQQLAAGTPASGARVQIVESEIIAHCEACDVEFPVARFRFVCPRCTSGDVRVVRGEELILESLTLISCVPADSTAVPVPASLGSIRNPEDLSRGSTSFPVFDSMAST